MSGDYVDQLARRLAAPTTRRRSLGLAAAGAVALATPLRPRFALAQGQGEIVCSPASGDCLEHVCSEGTICCTNTIDPGLCPTNPHCCDPCDPSASECLADGNCGPGPGGCKDECCRRFGQGPCCGSSGLCCTPDQVCDHSRGICCPPDSDPPKCNRPEAACEKRADELVKAQKSTVSGPGVAPGGLEAATSFAVIDLFSRYKEYDKCPQVPDDGSCASGGRCDPSTLTCRQCAGAGRRRRADDALRVERRAGTRRPLRRAAVSKQALADRLAERYKPRTRALRRLLAVARADREGPGPYPELAQAFDGYRKEIVRLRKSVAKGDGGSPQELLVEMCDDLARGLEGFREAALAQDRTAAQQLVLSAERSMKRGIKGARKLKRALGCGDRCL